MTQTPVALTVAVDAMSGDHGTTVCVEGALKALVRHPELTLLLVGRAECLTSAFDGLADDCRRRLRIVDAREVVAMDEAPREAIRRKKDSSLRRALDLVASGEARACVSAGNTGALMGCAHFVLGTVPGVQRAAIVAAIPTLRGHTFLLDLGANAQATAEQLLQFGWMGTVVAAADNPAKRPRVGLLNIGHEDIKGTPLVKAAHELMRASALDYAGYVEGDEIMSGAVDVVVTDGFTGNVALKAMEGLARMIVGALREEFTVNTGRKLGALAALPALRAVRHRLDSRRYNGASMVGLNGVVIKSHGGADATAFGYAVERAVVEARSDVPATIHGVLGTKAS